jgi:hypothetical protein
MVRLTLVARVTVVSAKVLTRAGGRLLLIPLLLLLIVGTLAASETTSTGGAAVAHGTTAVGSRRLSLLRSCVATLLTWTIVACVDVRTSKTRRTFTTGNTYHCTG